MEEQIAITGNSEAEIQQNLTAYLQQQQEAFEHRLIILQPQGKRVLLEIDIDPGGGFESGYATTRFSAQVTVKDDFAFTIHPEGFLADFAKLFGLQDEVVGYPEFDEKVIIKTNNKEKVKAVFADANTRQLLSTLDAFNLRLHGQDDVDTEHLLILEIEEGLTEPAPLMNLYKAFSNILMQVETTLV